MRQLLDSSTCINSSSYSCQPYSHPHTQWFISQLELTVSSTGILERIKNFTIPKSFIYLPSSDVFKKGNYYFLFSNNYICYKSLYAHDMIICFSAGFSYSVLL
jgi:hypothetical protein